METSKTLYVELFEGKPYCTKCRCKIRSIGHNAVGCNHTSLSIGIDKLTNRAYDDWMIVEADFAAIINKVVR